MIQLMLGAEPKLLPEEMVIIMIYKTLAQSET
jgi:hypothetical protein